MKRLVKLCLLMILVSSSTTLFAQKDSIWLQCPLNEATVVPPPKNVIHYDEPDLCIVLVSVPDTVVKACYNGRVTNVQQTEDGKWDVVFYYKDFYFWYSGLEKVIVKRNDNLKTGQPVGYVGIGQKMEMLLFNFETPVDPIRYLDCKGILKKE
jgi:Peptidase family M23